MTHPEMLPAPIQLVKLQLHSPAPVRLRGLVWTKRYRVVFAQWGKYVSNCLGIKAMSLELVLRGPQEKCSHKPHEISPLHPELVLREVPGKLA